MYDTTTRNKIEGEWIAFLIHFGKQKITLRLRAIPLLFEDRDNIVSLFVEQMKRLSTAVGVHPCEIWHRITAIMTDSVAKNLDVSDKIFEILCNEPIQGQQLLLHQHLLNHPHVPYQLLCSAHWCVNIDKKCFETYGEIEKQMEIKQKMIQRLPGLAAFIRGSKSIVAIAIEACTSLVLNTGKKTSMYKDFLKICEEDNLQRKVGSCSERRFGVLGHCAGTIIHHLPQFKKLLAATATNLHSKAVKLYLEEEFIVDAMVCLARITEFVTVPFLQMVQKSTNQQLLQIFPQLFHDLKHNSLSTLADFHTPFNFTFPPSNNSQQAMLKLMTKSIAEGLELQRGREYGFSTNASLKERATKISSIPLPIMEYLPTHNLDCERELSIFDRKISKCAGGYNQRSTFKGIRDEMMLYKAPITSIPSKAQSIIKELDRKEAAWYKQQKLKEDERHMKKQNSVQKSQGRFRDLLVHCKEWDGPCISVATMIAVEKSFVGNNDKLRTFYKTEITLNRLGNCHSNLSYGVNSKTIDELRSTLMAIIEYEESLDSSKTDEHYSHHLDDIMSQHF